MKQEVKEKWLSALRSGVYQQSTLQLKTDKGYCCLGVLCDLYLQDHKQKWVQKEDGVCYITEDNNRSTEQDSTLPAQVVAWAELPDSNPHIIETHTQIEWSLAEWNDDQGLDFNELADLIEEHL